MGFIKGSDIECEKRKRTKNDPRFLTWSTTRTELLLNETRKRAEGFAGTPELSSGRVKSDMPVGQAHGDALEAVRYEGLEFWEEIQTGYRNGKVTSSESTLKKYEAKQDEQEGELRWNWTRDPRSEPWGTPLFGSQGAEEEKAGETRTEQLDREGREQTRVSILKAKRRKCFRKPVVTTGLLGRARRRRDRFSCQVRSLVASVSGSVAQTPERTERNWAVSACKHFKFCCKWRERKTTGLGVLDFFLSRCKKQNKFQVFY